MTLKSACKRLPTEGAGRRSWFIPARGTVPGSTARSGLAALGGSDLLDYTAPAEPGTFTAQNSVSPGPQASVFRTQKGMAHYLANLATQHRTLFPH